MSKPSVCTLQEEPAERPLVELVVVAGFGCVFPSLVDCAVEPRIQGCICRWKHAPAPASI